MQSNDLLFVNVVGTNGNTRQQRTVQLRFRGDGIPINDKAEPISGVPAISGLPGSSGATPAPAFPQAEYQQAATSGDAERLQAILLAHADRVAAWQKQSGGGTEQVRVALSVLSYLKQYHDFHEEDGNWFVLKPENIDVRSDKLHDGRMLYTVAGTSVFGDLSR